MPPLASLKFELGENVHIKDVLMACATQKQSVSTYATRTGEQRCSRRMPRETEIGFRTAVVDIGSREVSLASVLVAMDGPKPQIRESPKQTFFQLMKEEMK